MEKNAPRAIPLSMLIATFAVAGPTLAQWSEADVEEWDEFVPLVEINASDGDVGFHVLVDGEGWETVSLKSPDRKLLFKGRNYRGLSDQGMTELFMESAEPPCWLDPEDDEADADDVVTVDDFIERFPEGEYRALGRTGDNEWLWSLAELTHNLPAAPLVDTDVSGDVVTVYFARGTDLGNCDYTPGSIPDPATVEVVRWEIVVEVDEDNLPEDFVGSTFSVQVPGTDDCGSGEGDWCSIVLPDAFLAPYLDAGVSEFKLEVGAMEESNNATFTETDFEM